MSARRAYPQDRARAAVRNIRQLRQRRGLTARQLGELCDPQIHYATLLKNEAENRLITVDELCRLADALNVTLEMLISGECDLCADDPPPGFVCSLCGAGG